MSSGRARRPDQTDGADFEREQLLETTSTQDSDDEFVLKNGEGGQYSNSRIKGVQQQVAEVTTIMKENVNKLFVRGDRLDELNERSENLRSAADEFHSASARLKKNMWWKEMRTRLILGSICILVVIIMIVWLAVKYNH